MTKLSYFTEINNPNFHFYVGHYHQFYIDDEKRTYIQKVLATSGVAYTLNFIFHKVIDGLIWTWFGIPFSERIPKMFFSVFVSPFLFLKNLKIWNLLKLKNGRNRGDHGNFLRNGVQKLFKNDKKNDYRGDQKSSHKNIHHKNNSNKHKNKGHNDHNQNNHHKHDKHDKHSKNNNHHYNKHGHDEKKSETHKFKSYMMTKFSEIRESEMFSKFHHKKIRKGIKYGILAFLILKSLSPSTSYMGQQHSEIVSTSDRKADSSDYYGAENVLRKQKEKKEEKEPEKKEAKMKVINTEKKQEGNIQTRLDIERRQTQINKSFNEKMSENTSNRLTKRGEKTRIDFQKVKKYVVALLTLPEFLKRNPLKEIKPIQKLTKIRNKINLRKYLPPNHITKIKELLIKINPKQYLPKNPLKKLNKMWKNSDLRKILSETLFTGKRPELGVAHCPLRFLVEDS